MLLLYRPQKSVRWRDEGAVLLYMPCMLTIVFVSCLFWCYIVELSLQALRDQIGVTAKPVHTNVMPWIKCMPQYTVGHSNRVAAVLDQLDQKWDGALTVTGASYYGVGVNDCVLNATRHAEKLIADHKA